MPTRTGNSTISAPTGSTRYTSCRSQAGFQISSVKPHTFRDGEIGKLQSIVPGSGPEGIQNDPKVFGDNPSLPRAALFTALSGLESQSGPLSDLFLGRTDNIDIRFAAAIALLFNVLMVVVAIIAIALTVPRDDPGVGR